MSLQRPKSAASRPTQSTGTAGPLLTPSGHALAAAKERALRQDPTLARSFRGHHGGVLSVAYSPVLVRAGDTKLPGYGVPDGGAASWEVGGTVSSRARAQKAASSYVQQLASGGADHVVLLWHLRPQLRAFRFLGHSGPVNAVAFSQDGELLASASDDTTVRVWTPTAEGKSIVLRGHVKRVRSIAWAADKQWLLSTSDDQQCKLWDVTSGVAHSHFHGHTQAVTSCAFSPDMRLVATGSADKTVKLFDLHNQSCIQTFYQNTGEVTCVKFHPYGNVLATGCSDNSIKLWDIRNNQLLQHYSAHDLDVSCIDFHPSGNYLLSSSLDSSIRLWDLRKGHQLYTIHGHPSAVNACAFTADGRSFVTGGDDQRVITWNSHLEPELDKASRGVGGVAFAALPRVGTTEDPSASKRPQRGALLASQVARPVQSNTGVLGRNNIVQGRRDAHYESEGLGSAFVRPEPSGPLPPTDLPRSLPPRLVGGRERIAPPNYTFRTGPDAGTVIGPGSLFLGDPDERQPLASPSAPEETTENDTPQPCDYRHTHLQTTTGAIHSFGDVHDPELAARARAIRDARAAAVAAGEVREEALEDQPLEEQLAGFAIPGVHGPTETGRASTRSGLPGPSRLASPRQQGDEPPHTARSTGPPSFAASAAGLQASSVQASVSRGRDGAVAPAPTGRNNDDFVYSFQSDRFVPASSHAHQAQTAEVAALRNTPGVDIFAIPPADHIQRLPEQLAHTLKYMVNQLDQVTRALNVFEYRMNLHEQKVERLEQQQARWSATDGY